MLNESQDIRLERPGKEKLPPTLPAAEQLSNQEDFNIWQQYHLYIRNDIIHDYNSVTWP